MPDNEKETIDDEELDGEENAEGEEGGKKSRLPGKKIVLFAGAPILGLILIVSALFMFGVLGGGGDEEDMHAEESGEGGGNGRIAASEVTFVELPEMLVNLNTADGRIIYLKLQVAIELPYDVNMDDINPIMPRVVDQFQLYLRELRLEDLQGSAGMFRLKEELLRRVNAAVAPVEVYDVLFREMIIQ